MKKQKKKSLNNSLKKNVNWNVKKKNMNNIVVVN